MSALGQPVQLIPAARPGLPDCIVANAAPGRALVVAIHGPDRDAAELALRLGAHPALAPFAIVAPCFTAESFGRYPELAVAVPGQTPADAALIALLADLSARAGLATGPVRLFGISGGAQMAQRFAMRHPARVARLCLASAEWYAMPDPALAWPYGLGDGHGGTLVGPEFLAIPTTVIVGNRDTRIDAAVRQDPQILAHQGRNRLRRARCYVRALSEHGARSGTPCYPELLAVHGISADFSRSVIEGDLVSLIARALL